MRNNQNKSELNIIARFNFQENYVQLRLDKFYLFNLSQNCDTH